jgi:hypothetical protein
MTNLRIKACFVLLAVILGACSSSASNGNLGGQDGGGQAGKSAPAGTGGIAGGSSSSSSGGDQGGQDGGGHRDSSTVAGTGGIAGGNGFDGGTPSGLGGSTTSGGGSGGSTHDARGADVAATSDTATALDGNAPDGGGGTLPQQCLAGLVNPFAALAPNWANWSSSSCSSLVAQDGSLVLTQSEPCSAASPNAIAGLAAPNVLCGDFDVQVDYAVTGLVAGVTGGIFASMRANDLEVTTNGMTIERYAAGYLPANGSYQNYKSYTTNKGEDATSVLVPTTDVTGRFRLTRTGTTVKSYYWKAGNPDGQWVLVNTATLTGTPWGLVLYEGDNSPANAGPTAPYSVTFSNLLVTFPGATDAGTELAPDAAPDASTSSAYGNGLIGLWNLDETAAGTAPGGADFADVSGQGHPGTKMGGVILGAAGKIGNAATLDGASGYIHTGLTASPTSYTLSAWVKLNAYPTSDAVRIFSSAGWGNYSGAMDWGCDDSHRLFVIHQANNGQDVLRSVSTTLVPLGAWVHTAVTYDAARLSATLWVNGQAVAGTFDAGNSMRVPNATSAYGFNIGAVGNLANDVYLDGTVDQVAMWNRELTSGEIAGLYNAGTGIVLP